MNTYLLLFSLSLIVSLILTPLVRLVCERNGWTDEPGDARRVHTKPVPCLGGVAIILSMGLALSVLPLIHNLVTQSVRDDSARIWRVVVPATLVFLFGIFDDLRGANAKLKFTAQGLAGVIFCLMGGRIAALSIPLLGSIELHPLIGYALTLFWLVGISNAFNLIDGMDGLATGAALFASLVMLVVSLVLGHPLICVISIVMAGALVGFLRYNFNPASIFLGDSGALFIGFILATLSVEGTQKASTAIAVAIPLLAFGMPVFDTGFTIVRRFIGGRPLFEGDREHIHHMLLDRGWSQMRVALVLYGVCSCLGLAALLFVSDAGRTTGLVLFIIGIATILAINHLRYHEVDEIGASVKRNLGERRLRAANHVRVRRASRDLSKATTLSEIFTAVEQMLEFGEFVYATVQLGQGGNDYLNEQVLLIESGSPALRRAGIRGGLIFWSWERGDIEAENITGSGHFWTLRLPLTTKSAGWGYLNLYRAFGTDDLLLDINYICHLFQREMSQAVERVMNEAKVEELKAVATSAR